MRRRKPRIKTKRTRSSQTLEKQTVRARRSRSRLRKSKSRSTKASFLFKRLKRFLWAPFYFIFTGITRARDLFLQKRSRWNVSRGIHFLWGVFFGFWLVLISGYFSGWSGTPGLAQYLKLNALIRERQKDVTRMEAQREVIETELKKISRNSFEKERLVREVLGYARKDELVFDFDKNRSSF